MASALLKICKFNNGFIILNALQNFEFKQTECIKTILNMLLGFSRIYRILQHLQGRNS